MSETKINDILDYVGAEPILVVDPEREGELVGILTAEDFL